MVTMQELLEAGAHFGHKKSRRNPAFTPFIHSERNGIHIINAAYTLIQLERGAEFLRDTVARGGKVLFVATKQQAREVVEREAERAGQFYVTFRWLGGLLTNFKTVRSSIQRMKMLEEGEEDSRITLTKKEQLSRTREFEKLHRVLKGVREMRKQPDAAVIIDINHEAIAVHECRVLNIPVVGIVDTNSDPTQITHPIPGNDDAVRAIELYTRVLADACIEGARLYEERAQAEEEEIQETELTLDREEDLDEAALLSRRKVYKVKKTLKPDTSKAETDGDTAAQERVEPKAEAEGEAAAKKKPAGKKAAKAPAKVKKEKVPKSEAKDESKDDSPAAQEEATSDEATGEQE